MGVLGGAGTAGSTTKKTKTKGKRNTANKVYVDLLARGVSVEASTKADVLEFVAKSIQSNIEEDISQGTFDTLRTSIGCAHSYMTAATGDRAMTAHHGWGYVQALILCLDAVCESCLSCGDINGLQFVLMCQIPLLLRLKGTPTAASFVMDTDALLQTCLDRCNGLFVASPESSELGLGGLDCNNIGYRVLVALLSNSNGPNGDPSLLSSAIQSFFMSEGAGSQSVLVDVLVQIGMGQVVGQVSATDAQLFVPQGCSGGVWDKVAGFLSESDSQSLVVPSDARVGGLVTFGAVLSGGSAQVLPRLVDTVPLLLMCCSDSNSAVRSAATTAASLITQSVWFTEADKKQTVSTVSISVLQQLLEAIGTNSDMIVNDGAGIASIPMKNSAVSVYLIEAIVSFGWTSCNVTNLMLEMVVNQMCLGTETGSFSDSNATQLWSTMLLLLESHGPSVGSGELLDRLMDPLQLLFTMGRYDAHFQGRC